MWLVLLTSTQKHFLCTIVGSDNTFSPLEIHICWNVLNDDKIEPPIHTEYFLSGGATGGWADGRADGRMGGRAD